MNLPEPDRGGFLSNLKRAATDLFENVKRRISTPFGQETYQPDNFPLFDLTPAPMSMPTVIPQTPPQYQDSFNKSSTSNITPDILSAIAQVENKFQSKGKSSAGAQGMFQLMPVTIKELKRLGYNGGKEIDPNDPLQAIPAASFYLDHLYGQLGDLDLTLAAYNAGIGNVKKYGGIPPFPETQNYIRQIHELLGK